MTERIRDRATFEALAGVRPFRRGPLSLRYLPDGPDARVAYAVGRATGRAVQRNRIRRRLRAAVRELDAGDGLPPGAYLIGAGPEALTMPFADLRRALEGLVADRGSA